MGRRKHEPVPLAIENVFVGQRVRMIGDQKRVGTIHEIWESKKSVLVVLDRADAMKRYENKCKVDTLEALDEEPVYIYNPEVEAQLPEDVAKGLGKGLFDQMGGQFDPKGKGKGLFDPTAGQFDAKGKGKGLFELAVTQGKGKGMFGKGNDMADPSRGLNAMPSRFRRDQVPMRQNDAALTNPAHLQGSQPPSWDMADLAAAFNTDESDPQAKAAVMALLKTNSVDSIKSMLLQKAEPEAPPEPTAEGDSLQDLLNSPADGFQDMPEAAPTPKSGGVFSGSSSRSLGPSNDGNDAALQDKYLATPKVVPRKQTGAEQVAQQWIADAKQRLALSTGPAPAAARGSKAPAPPAAVPGKPPSPAELRAQKMVAEVQQKLAQSGTVHSSPNVPKTASSVLAAAAANAAAAAAAAAAAKVPPRSGYAQASVMARQAERNSGKPPEAGEASSDAPAASDPTSGAAGSEQDPGAYAAQSSEAGRPEKKAELHNVFGNPQPKRRTEDAAPAYADQSIRSDQKDSPALASGDAYAASGQRRFREDSRSRRRPQGDDRNMRRSRSRDGGNGRRRQHDGGDRYGTERYGRGRDEGRGGRDEGRSRTFMEERPRAEEPRRARQHEAPRRARQRSPSDDSGPGRTTPSMFSKAPIKAGSELAVAEEDVVHKLRQQALAGLRARPRF